MANIVKKTNYLLSLSGGQDSILLLFTNLHNKPSILHLNHLFQKDNFNFCIHYLRLNYFLSLNHHLCVTLKIINNEYSGTIWRYKIFERLCTIYDYGQLLIAKQKTDINEKFFIDLLKGKTPSLIPNKKIKYYYSIYSFLF